MEQPGAADLFSRHHLALFRYAYRMTGRREIAEDVVQDVFVRVVRGLEAYRPDGRDLSWLFSIARRLLLDRMRTLSRRPIEVAQSDEPRVSASQEMAAALEQALGDLPDADREAFLLREVGGLSYEEIAAVSKGTVDSVRSRIYRARLRLKDTLTTGERVAR